MDIVRYVLTSRFCRVRCLPDGHVWQYKHGPAKLRRQPVQQMNGLPPTDVSMLNCMRRLPLGFWWRKTDQMVVTGAARKMKMQKI